MKTLKEIIQKEEDLAANVAEPIDALESMSRRLMCIVTAFELLSGQGASFLVNDVNSADRHLYHRRSIEYRSVRICHNIICQSDDSHIRKRRDRIYQIRQAWKRQCDRPLIPRTGSGVHSSVIGRYQLWRCCPALACCGICQATSRRLPPLVEFWRYYPKSGARQVNGRKGPQSRSHVVYRRSDLELGISRRYRRPPGLSTIRNSLLGTPCPS